MASESDKQRIIIIAKEIGYKISQKSLDELTKVEANKIYIRMIEKKSNKK